MRKTLKMLQQLKHDNKISVQQFRTFKGQVLSGNTDGCIKGLKRMNLI